MAIEPAHYDTILASKMRRLGTETAFDVLVKAQQLEKTRPDLVHLEIGEPDFDTPANIVEAAIQALRDGHTHYGPSAGLPILREAIAEHIGRTRKIPVTPEMVVVTPGAKPIMFFAMLELLDEGDEVIYPNPGFPIYESVIRFNFAVPVPFPITSDAQGFRFDVARLEERVTPRTKMIIVNSPHNPTGAVLTPEELAEVARVACRHNLIVLSDEVYSHLVYDGEFRSIASLEGMSQRTILMDGFSKTYAMTGWRMGYGVMPPILAQQMAKLQTNCTSCTATFSQIACVEALTGPQDGADQMRERFRGRRDVILEGICRIPGFQCPRPPGAFYVFPDITGTGCSSAFLEDYLLREAAVASLSGTSFGSHGEGYLRFSYANSSENIRRAMERVRVAIARLA